MKSAPVTIIFIGSGRALLWQKLKVSEFEKFRCRWQTTIYVGPRSVHLKFRKEKNIRQTCLAEKELKELKHASEFALKSSSTTFQFKRFTSFHRSLSFSLSLSDRHDYSLPLSLVHTPKNTYHREIDHCMASLHFN